MKRAGLDTRFGNDIDRIAATGGGGSIALLFLLAGMGMLR